MRTAGSGPRHRVWVAALIGPLVIGVLALSGTPAAAAPSPPAPSGVVKYYIVPVEVNGQPDYLYQIATDTLGNGNRYQEIFDLNKGRPQPGGDRLTDPTELEPGWVLILPPDAHGPDVHIGPLPPVPPIDSGPPSGATSGPSADPAATSAGPPSTGTGSSRSGAGTLFIVLVTVLLLGAVLVLVVLRTTRAGRRRGRAGAARTGGLDGPAGGTDPVPTGTGLTAPRPAGDGIELSAVVTTPRGPLEVRLQNAGDERKKPVYGWLGPGEELTGAGMPVVVGEHDGWRLWVDLTGTPDLLTITGPIATCRRQIRDVIAAVRTLGVAVTVVGDALGDSVPADCVGVMSFPTQLPDSGPALVISGGLRGSELRVARRVARDTGGRVVPVLIGDVMRARWSLSFADAPPTPGTENLSPAQ